MKQHVFFSLFFLTSIANPAPWFTGPIIAPATVTLPAGRVNPEPYYFHIDNYGQFDNQHKKTTQDQSAAKNVTLFLDIGINDWMDFQLNIPYIYHKRQGLKYQTVGDANIGLGFQVLRQNNKYLIPNLRLTLIQVLPTGKYESLDAELAPVAFTGHGSFQTGIGLNFGYMKHLKSAHYLSQRLALFFNYASTVQIRGFSAYGGDATTRGKIKPGSMASITYAAELSLTQNWVGVFEIFTSTNNHGKYSPYTPAQTGQRPIRVGDGNSYHVSLSPAIEYNFNANVGIIAGPWFSVMGKNSARFRSAVVAVNITI